MSLSQSVSGARDEKNHTSTNQVFEFRAKIPAFHIYALAAYSVLALESSCFVDIKKFPRSVFSWKSEKHLGQLVWNSFVYFTVDEEKSQ